jgi:hypothetical protein
MKKNLLLLTGIVFVITILVSGGCKRDTQPKVTPTADKGIQQVRDPKVFISLKAISIEGEVHLLMSDSKNPDCEVIDNLITVVYAEDTVIWKKGPNSNIRTIDQIILHEGHGFSSEFFIVDDSLIALQIPSIVRGDTIKYDIVFTHRHDVETDTIDPYLRIED